MRLFLQIEVRNRAPKLYDQVSTCPVVLLPTERHVHQLGYIRKKVAHLYG